MSVRCVSSTYICTVVSTIQVLGVTRPLPNLVFISAPGLPLFQAYNRCMILYSTWLSNPTPWISALQYPCIVMSGLQNLGIRYVYSGTITGSSDAVPECIPDWRLTMVFVPWPWAALAVIFRKPPFITTSHIYIDLHYTSDQSWQMLYRSAGPRLSNGLVGPLTRIWMLISHHIFAWRIHNRS